MRSIRKRKLYLVPVLHCKYNIAVDLLYIKFFAVLNKGEGITPAGYSYSQPASLYNRIIYGHIIRIICAANKLHTVFELNLAVCIQMAETHITVFSVSITTE